MLLIIRDGGVGDLAVPLRLITKLEAGVAGGGFRYNVNCCEICEIKWNTYLSPRAFSTARPIVSIRLRRRTSLRAIISPRRYMDRLLCNPVTCYFTRVSLLVCLFILLTSLQNMTQSKHSFLAHPRIIIRLRRHPPSTIFSISIIVRVSCGSSRYGLPSMSIVSILMPLGWSLHDMSLIRRRRGIEMCL